jgi:hypothetical protein
VAIAMAMPMAITSCHCHCLPIVLAIVTASWPHHCLRHRHYRCHHLRGLETDYHDTHRAIGLDSSRPVAIVPNGGSQHWAFIQWIPHRQLLTWLHHQTFITEVSWQSNASSF